VIPATCCRDSGHRHRLDLGDLARAFGAEYAESHRLKVEQRKALRAIARCRTPALGGCVEVCANCGHRRTVYRSCRNRHCPKCQTVAKERWLEARCSELLPIEYAHVVFTLPHSLNALAVNSPALVYDLLFKAASQTLLAFARDPDRLGAEPAIVVMLHTWGQNLGLHIHVHCIVSVGGLDATGRVWRGGRSGYLFPVRAMSQVFRGKYLQALRERAPHAATELEPELRKTDWVVYSKVSFPGPRAVVDYLARYAYRVALTNDRLLGIEGRKVRIRWRDYAHGRKRKVLTLDVTCLLRRFLQHVLPNGFKRVRHYGLLAPRHKAAKLDASRRYFRMPAPAPPRPVLVLLRAMGVDAERCPSCGASTLRREPLLPNHPAVTHDARAP
jgi:putative transposase/transposase-like zinc-binding protein